MKRVECSNIAIFLLVLISAIFLGSGSMAQEHGYQYKKLRIPQNAPFNSIFCITKDNAGIYWVGSEQGLYRYDGNTFDHFELIHSEGSTIGLKIFDLKADGDNLLVASSRGIFLLNLRNHSHTLLSKSKDKVESAIRVIKDKRNDVWWLNQNGWVYHKKGNELYPINLNIHQGYEINFSSMLVEGDFIWVTAFERIFKINIHDHKLEYLKLPENIKNIHALKVDQEGRKFICSESGLFQFKNSNTSVNNFVRLDRFGENVFDVQINPKDTFIIKDRKSVLHYFNSKSKQNFKKLDIQFESPQSIDRLFQFDEHIFLATTDGLWVVKRNTVLFDIILSTYNKQSNAFEVPRAIVQDDDDIYLANYNLIVKYQSLDGSKIVINNEALVTHGMIKEKDTLWMATEGNGFMQYIIPKRKKIFYNYRLNERGNLMICLEKMDENRIMVGGYNNLYVFNKKNKIFESIVIKKGNEILRDLQINQIKKINENRYLIATNIGLMYIDVQGNVLQDLYSKIQDENLKNTNAFWLKDSNTIWAGTSNGVLQLDGKGNILKHLNVMNGLAGNKVASMTGDGKSHLWIGTYTGLSAVNLSNFNIINYFKEDGLPSNEFNHSSYLLAKNGEIYMGTVNGFIKFLPSSIIEKKFTKASLKISKMDFGDQQKHGVKYFGMYQESGPIHLGKGNNFVKLHYYIDPIDPFASVKYEYKISGIHYDWITVGENPVLHIDNFQKGKYNLYFRAITGLGSQEIITATVPLVVSQYFYYETWFYVLLVSLILVFVILYLFGSLQKDRRLSEIRQGIAQDLHDEIGSYLTAISMNTDLLERGDANQRNYFNEIRKLNRRAMNALRQNIWSLGTSSDDCQQFWDHIKSMVTEQFENFDIPFSFEEIEGLKDLRLTLQQKRYMLFALMECVTNIIKHSDYNAVSFHWKLVNGEHEIHIKNQYRSDHSNSTTGYGLDNIGNRMKSIGADASYTREDGTFIMILKLKFLS
ncbi:MAG: ligand-binding sensor domain-containing protein [Chitinophagaceae bacterium]